MRHECNSKRFYLSFVYFVSCVSMITWVTRNLAERELLINRLFEMEGPSSVFIVGGLARKNFKLFKKELQATRD